MGKKDARRRKEEGEEEGKDGNEIRVDFPLKKKKRSGHRIFIVI